MTAERDKEEERRGGSVELWGVENRERLRESWWREREGEGAMAARGRIPPYMILLVVAFALVGFVGFQTLKERKNASAILVAKDFELEKFKEQHDKVLQASKKELVKLTKDKEKLSHQVIQLEHFKDEYEDNKKQLTSCKQETEKSVKQVGEQKETEVNSLKEKLQDKDSEISAIKAQLAQARNIENHRDRKPEAEGLEERDEKEEAPRKEANNESAEKSMFGEKHSELVTSQKPEKQKQTSDSILDDRNATTEEYSSNSKGEGELEDSKGDADLEDAKTSTADLEESELAATKAVGVEDDDDKELETDVKLAASDAAVEINENLAQLK